MPYVRLLVLAAALLGLAANGRPAQAQSAPSPKVEAILEKASRGEPLTPEETAALAEWSKTAAGQAKSRALESLGL